MNDGSEIVAATCVPPEEEAVFVKHSPRRSESSGEKLEHYGAGFSEDFKIQFDPQAGPSNSDNFGKPTFVYLKDACATRNQTSRVHKSCC